MEMPVTSPYRMRIIQVADVLSLLAGAAIVGASFAPLFRRDLEVSGLPAGQAAVACSAWTPCPGSTGHSMPMPLDFSAALRWLVVLAAAAAVVFPFLRLASVRYRSARWATVQVVVTTTVLLATTAVIWLVTAQARSVGYNEENREFSMHPAAGTAGLIASLLMVCIASVVARANSPRHGRELSPSQPLG